MSHKTNYREIPGHLKNREPFVGNTMTAECGPQDPWRTGNLKKWERDFRAYQQNADLMIYCVRSYFTPVAWVLQDGEVYVSNRLYSPTTTRAQMLCRDYL